ncbi:MAG TPA: gamma-glutamyl-gamma-aminobutyrate hydrolase family protein, partial [Alphaproteobacteria bacterium]|nr:gamma-glutamyl-gamma-aminobutyrate hydrolase family protein [Alphaproteobacteria bacterium]
MAEPGITGIVAITCNYSDDGTQQSHRAGHKYVAAVREVAGALPLLLPALGEDAPVAHLLDSVDGVLLTGGVSNVEPHRYGGDGSVECGPHDPLRDGLALGLARGAVERGLP